MTAVQHVFNKLFPLWAVLLGTLGYYFPTVFTPMAPAITWLLALIMFAMGLTLSGKDFYRVFKQPKAIGIGVFLQFTIMPLTALAASRALSLNAELTTGMVLVGAASGGTASNVICWLAGGRVALSVSLTLTSTLLSVFLTPLITWALLQNRIDINIAGMLLSIAKIVIAPVLLGIIVHHFYSNTIKRYEPALASISVASISLIIAIVVALNAGRFSSLGLWVLVAVALHNATGLTLGFWTSKLCKLDNSTCRTVAIEVGMQNSGLAVALAQQFFSAAAALPGALFSVWHNVSGSLLASYWSKNKMAGRSRPE